MSASSRIRLLPDTLINQIAAGEVVERPASAVKELLENALDAGADRIVIDIEHGGKRLIRIADNGTGIHPDDLPMAVTRHATSKIQTMDDLIAAASLGFRGEALPSIASVSHLTIRSTVTGAAEGRELWFDDDGTPQVRAAAPSPGTTVEVAELFYNTPARAKFLKGDPTEWGHIVETVNEVALGAPAVHFSMAHNGRAPKVYPATADLAARVRQIYPNELTEQLIPVDFTDPESGIGLSGMVSRPGFTRSGRDHQKLLVNGRCIRNPTLTHAVYAAFETNLPAGRHPVFFLALTVPAETVDVNVHPAKREVRFAKGNRLHHWVREGVRQALGNFKGNTLRLTRMVGPDQAEQAGWEERVRKAVLNSIDTAREPATAHGWGDAAPRAEAVGQTGMSAAIPADSPAAPATQLPLGETAESTNPMRVVGQLHDTFVLVEQRQTLRIIDQHTAHERVLFERLMARFMADGIPSQGLLIPRDVTLSPAHCAQVEAHREELLKVGIDIEPFGGQAFLVRAVPAPLANADIQELIHDIADDIAESVGTDRPIAERLHPILATIACHAAVKSGDPLTERQMTELIRDLEQVENPHTCPHGRAVTATLERSAIKRLFDRSWGD